MPSRRRADSHETVLHTLEVSGVKIVEAARDTAIVHRARDFADVLEVCLSARSRAVLLYPANLPSEFLDLSSGLAGDLLEKIQRFGLRLAIVAAPESVQPSTRFHEILNRHLALFPSREEAVDWLTRPA